MSLEQDQQTPDSARIADEKVKAQKKAALDLAASGAPVAAPTNNPSIFHRLTHNPFTNFVGDVTGGGNIVQGAEKIASGNIMGGLGNIALGVGEGAMAFVPGLGEARGALEAGKVASGALKYGAKVVAPTLIGNGVTSALGFAMPASAATGTTTSPQSATPQSATPQSATPQALQQMVTNFNTTNPQLLSNGLTLEQGRQYEIQHAQAQLAYQQLLQNAGLQSQIAQQQYQQGINQTNQGASGNTIATRAMLAGTGMDTSPGIADASLQNIQDVAGYQNKLATTAYGQEQKQRALASAQAGRLYANDTTAAISDASALGQQNQAARYQAMQDLINKYKSNGGK